MDKVSVVLDRELLSGKARGKLIMPSKDCGEQAHTIVLDEIVKDGRRIPLLSMYCHHTENV